MAWPYAFITLSNEAKAQRRELLDWYGAFAQFSALLPLLALQLYFLISWLRRRSSNPNDFGTPSSPRAKEAKEGGVESWDVRLRRVRWWLGGKVVLPGGEVVGSRGEVLGAVGWGMWLLGLSFRGTGRDYLHLTKRLGIIAASQLPFHYLLALKSPYSPLQYLTGRSHESLNTLHQLLGRVITLLIYVHAALYLNFYIQSNLLAEKFQEGYVICGIVGVVAFTAIGTTALGPVRRWSYRVFYVTHVVLATLLLPVLWFHVSHLRVYLYETAAVYAVNVLLRGMSSKTVSASLRVLEQGTMVEITIPLASAGKQKRHLQRYQPGQHAYLSLPGHAASRTSRSNPFSVASVPSVDNELRFVARILDGNTAVLATAAKLDGKHEVTIEGPYGLAAHAEKLLTFDRVFFVAGGVGGTFIAPLYRQLLADLSPSPGSHRRQKVSFVWIARAVEDVDWAMPREDDEKRGFLERLQVWITQAGSHSRRQGGVGFDTGYPDDGDEGIELQESKGLITQDVGEREADLKATGLTLRSGRPDSKRLLEETFSCGVNERVAVVVCGPGSLSRALRDDVGLWVDAGRDVWFWDEGFAL